MIIKTNYTIETRNNVTGVMEHTTGHFIPIAKNKVKKICDSLNWGSGFDGNTPKFFTTEVSYAND